MAEVIRRRQFVLRIFQANAVGKMADGLVSGVPLSERQGLTGPVDDRCRADLLFLTRSGERRKAAQQLLRVTQHKAGTAPQGQIVVDGDHHEFTPGHG